MVEFMRNGKLRFVGCGIVKEFETASDLLAWLEGKKDGKY